MIPRIIGAAVGVVVALGVSYLGVALLEWPMAYPHEWIAVGVGVVSGLYLPGGGPRRSDRRLRRE